MAVAKQRQGTTAAADSRDRKKLRGAIIAILLILLAAAAAAAGILFAGRFLFTGNPRLTLREIRVNGTGYWKEHPEQLAAKAGLTKGTNLFSLDLRETRSRIKAISNIDNCSVIRLLPDTLVIKVTERVPRALLNRWNSPWVVDSGSVVMPKMQAMQASGRMPVITDVDLRNVRPGMVMKELQCAVDLIMMTVRNFPDIKIYRISLKDPKKMDIRLSYRRFPVCRVIIPVKNRGLSFMLLTLQSAILNTRRMRETRYYYDLSYDGKVVVR